MARSFKKNKVRASILGYYYYIRGVEKSGKTTLFYELINELFNGDQTKGLLISMGKEDGYRALPDIQYEVIDNKIDPKTEKILEYGWDKFVELVDDLVKEKEENGIELIAIDTYDEFTKIVASQVVRMHNKKTPLKQCETINGAFGGYNGGFEKFEDLAEEQIHRLREVGYTVFVISHTKVRTIKEKGMNEDESYQMLTTNLDSRYDNVVAHKADVIATIQVEKDIKDGKIQNSNRWIYFRESNFVKAGTRFKDICEKTELSAINFIKAVEDGIKSSMRSDITNDEFEQQKETDEKNRKEEAKKNIEKIKEMENESSKIDIDKNTELKDAIQEIFKKADKDGKAKIKQAMEDCDIKKLGDVEVNITENMEKLLSIIQ